MEDTEEALINKIKIDRDEIWGSSSRESGKLVKEAIHHVLKTNFSEAFSEQLKEYCTQFSYNSECSNSNKYHSKIKAAFARLEGKMFLDDAWGKTVNPYLDDKPELIPLVTSIDDLYIDVFDGKPTKTWMKKLDGLMKLYCPKHIHDVTKSLLNNLLSNAEVKKNGLSYSNERRLFTLLHVFRYAAVEQDAQLVKNLATLCYAKVPYIGSISLGSANLCLEILESLDGVLGLVALNELSLELKYPANAKKNALKKLEAVAKVKGVDVDQLQDEIVPDFGLT
jgi:hypothetical protein